MRETPPPSGRPTLDERVQLADAYQRQALERSDPGQANLQFLAGDLLHLAAAQQHQQAAGSESTLDAAALERRVNCALRLARQFTCMHRLVDEPRSRGPGATEHPGRRENSPG